MNPTNNPVAQLTELIGKKQSGVIVLPQNPTLDGVASATALYIGLSKLGKNVTIVCSTAVKSDLVGTDKIQNSFATTGDNLVISFPYTEGAVDKVEYGGTEGNFFNIIIMPRTGGTKLDPKKVQFTYTGGKVDFIITIDAPSLRSLGAIFAENQQEFQGKSIINIDRHLVNDMFGMVNIVNKTSSSTAELVLRVMTSLQIQLDKDMATNLYAGLAAATNNFTSYSVNASTFETAANLLKMGAVKRMVRPAGTPGMPPAPMGFPSNMQRPVSSGGMPFPNRPRPMSYPAMPTMPREQQETGLDDIEDEPDEFEDDSNAQTPQGNFLKPNISRGGGLI